MEQTSRFIPRDPKRSINDDYRINIQERIKPYGSGMGAVRIYNDEGEMIGWQLKPIYE